MMTSKFRLAAPPAVAVDRPIPDYESLLRQIRNTVIDFNNGRYHTAKKSPEDGYDKISYLIGEMRALGIDAVFSGDCPWQMPSEHQVLVCETEWGMLEVRVQKH